MVTIRFSLTNNVENPPWLFLISNGGSPVVWPQGLSEYDDDWLWDWRKSPKFGGKEGGQTSGDWTNKMATKFVFVTCLDTNKNRGLNQHIAITPTPMGLKTRNQSGSHQPFSGLKPDFTKKHGKIIHKATSWHGDPVTKKKGPHWNFLRRKCDFAIFHPHHMGLELFTFLVASGFQGWPVLE